VTSIYVAKNGREILKEEALSKGGGYLAISVLATKQQKKKKKTNETRSALQKLKKPSETKKKKKKKKKRTICEVTKLLIWQSR
jgi:hypothetical protein